jgi:hypothetical protein
MATSTEPADRLEPVFISFGTHATVAPAPWEDHPMRPRAICGKNGMRRLLESIA